MNRTHENGCLSFITARNRISLLLFLLFFIFSGTPAKAVDNPLILDTDLSSDVDDAGAVAVLHSLADQGKVQILAMMVSSGDPWSGPCLDALNTSFGRPDIPIGLIKHQAVTHVSRYTQHIAENYPHDFPADSSKQQEAVTLYRKILANQSAHSVTVVSIGYLSNLSRLLESGPDEYSPLDGKKLVLEKVKRLICMGGNFPSGREWNIYQDAGAAAAVVSEWPTPVLFCGFEVGNNILTGKVLQKVADRHPLKEAYRLYNNIANRQSWDQMTVLLAANPENMTTGYVSSGEWEVSAPGRVQIDQNGNNTWEARRDGRHRYILSTRKTKDLAQVIDDLMLDAASAGKTR